MSSTFSQQVCIISLLLSFNQLKTCIWNSEFFLQAFILKNQISIEYNMVNLFSP